MIGTLSFANSSSIISPIKVKKAEVSVGCCTVGLYTVCEGSWPCISCANPCDVARRWYCANHPCTDATIRGIGSGGCGGNNIRACGCGDGGGSPSGGTIVE